MASRISSKTGLRGVVRHYRKMRAKKKLALKAAERPRFVVFRSNKFLYAQLVDDVKGHTVISANTGEEAFKSLESRKNREAAKVLGKLVGERAAEKKIDKVVFDRNGYNYHGRIKAIADAAREAGLRF